MRFRRAALALGTAALLGAAVAASGAVPAQAAGQICAQSGTGYCLNDWNGGGIGASVKMGSNGWPHQSFGNVQLTGMCGHGVVTGTCPFANLALDSALTGSPIEAVKYSGGGCVGTGNTDNRAFLVVCPDSNGNGGGWGSVFVQDAGTCSVHLDNRHWTDAGGTSTLYDLVSGGATGAQAVVSADRSGSSCWGTG